MSERDEKMVKANVSEPEGSDRMDAAVEDNFIVNLRKTYVFEGKAYEKIDLSGMENLTGADLIAINKILQRSGYPVPETSMEYALHFAARSAQLPVEFFTGLASKEAMVVKNKVMNFLFGSD